MSKSMVHHSGTVVEGQKAGKPVGVVAICPGCCPVTTGMCVLVWFSYVEGQMG
jgi:hypothetical protein